MLLDGARNYRGGVILYAEMVIASKDGSVSDIPVDIWQLARDEDGRDVVLLHDGHGRILPIIIDACTAAAIWVAISPDMAKPYVRRPWTHDLMQAMLERLGASIERGVIDGFLNGAFLATLHLRYREEELVVDARPSDTIALLLRVTAPLFVNDEVMSEGAFSIEETDSDDDGDSPFS